jgi:hypothetical protein
MYCLLFSDIVSGISEHAETFRDFMLQLTANSLATGRSKFILRKLFGSPFQSCHSGLTSINGPFEGQEDRVGRYP